MSASIDERIVQMKFDNKDFENNVQASIWSLGKLKEALKFTNATDSVNTLSKATQKLDFSAVTSAITELEDRFSTMGIIGMTAIQNLTNAAINFASTWVSKIPSMISQGGWTRAMNIENAHFQLQGLISDEEEVVKVMKQASDSVDGTAYSYDAAAKAASMFAATGLKSGTELGNALKAIAGVAATTNADYESISNIFTTIAGNGRVMGEQLNQLSYRGMNAAAALTKYFNGVHDGSIEASEGVKSAVDAMMGGQKGLAQSAEEVKKALEDQYKAAEKAYNEEYKAQQKALNKEYKEYQKSLNKEYELKKETYEKEYKALQDALQSEIDAQKEANSKRIDEANAAYDRDVENYRKATEAKIALIDEEYAESLKLIDEEAYNRLKAIDDEINAINAEAEAEEKARKQQQREEKLAALTAAVSSAETLEAKEKAQEALDAYNKQIAQEDLAEQRKLRIAELREQKITINEEADLKREAAKEKRDAAVDAVAEEYDATISEMDKKHKEEMDILQKTLNEQLQVMIDSNNDKLTNLKKQQNDELEIFREGQQDQLEEYKENQNNQLEALREANNEKLKEMQEALQEQEKAASKFAATTQLTEADIRDMVSKGLVSFDIFSEAMATTFGDHAKDANKTFRGALSNIRAALARTGAMFVSDIIVQEGMAVKLFNELRMKINDMNGVLKPFAADVTHTINVFIRQMAEMVSKIPIEDITTIATNMARSLAKVFKFIGSMIKPILLAFSNNFKFDISGVVEFSNKLLDLTKKLNVTGNNIARIYKLADGLIKIFKNIGDLVLTFGKSFLSAFSGIEISFKGLEGIADKVTKAIKKFNEEFLKSEETQNAVASAGYVVGTIFKIIIDIISSGISKVKEFVATSETLQSIFTSLKSIVSKIGKLFKSVFDSISKSISDTDTNKLDILKEKLSFLEGPLNLIKKIGGVVAKGIASILEAVDKSINVDTSGFDILTSSLEKLKSPVEFLKNVGISVFETLKKILEPLGKTIKDVATDIWSILSGTNPIEMLVTYINTRLIAGLGKSIISVFDTINKVLVTQLLASLTSLFTTLTTLTGSMEGLQSFALSLRIMAESLLILSAACLILQSIDSEGLTKSAAAIGVLMAELTGAYIAMKNLSKGGGKVPLFNANLKEGIFSYGGVGGVGNAIYAIATAIGVLSLACYALSKLDYESLIKGISAVSVLLWELTGVVIAMSRGSDDKKIQNAGASLLGLSIALLIITKAVKELATLNAEDLLKGVLAVNELILVLGGFVTIVGGAEKMISIGIGLIIVANAVKTLTNSVLSLAELDLESLLKGTGAVSALLLVLGGFTKLAGGSKGLISIGLGLIEVGVAVGMLSSAIKNLSDIDGEQLLISVMALSIIMSEIGILLFAIKDGAIVKALAIIEVAAAVVLIGNTLKELDGVDPVGLLASVMAIGAILTEIGVMLWAIKDGAVLKGLAAIEMAAAVVLIGGTLKKMDGLDPEGLLISVMAISIILSEIAICLMGIPKTAPIKALGAIEMAASAVLIALSLKMLGDIPGDRILAATIALVAALAAITACLIVIPPQAVLGGLAAIEMAASTVIVAMALKELAAIDSKDLSKALLALLGALAILEAAMVAIGAIGPIALAGAAIMLGIAGSLALSGLMLAPALMAIADAIMYWQNLDMTSFGETISKISLAITTFGKALKNYNMLAGSSAKALKTVAEALLVLGPAMLIFNFMTDDGGKKLATSFEVVGKGIETFGKSLKSFGMFSEIGAASLIGVAKGLSVMAPALVLLTAANPEKLANEMEILGTGFAKFGEALKSYDIFSGIGASAIKILADAIGVLAPALEVLTEIDADKAGYILTTIGEAFKIFGEALEATPFWGASKRADGISILAGDVQILADALPALMDLDADKVSIVLYSIGEAFRDFGTALSNAPFWSPEDRGEAIGILVEEIQHLGEVLPVFMKLDPTAVSSSLQTIGDAFKSFGEALDSAPFWGVENRGEAITTLVGSIRELSRGINSFVNADFDPKDVKSSIIQISTAFKSFGESLGSAPYWNPEDRGSAVKVLSSSVKKLAEGLEYFINKVDGEKVEDAINYISTAFSSFAKALKSTPWFSVGERTKGILALVNNITNLADGVAHFISSTDGKSELAKDILAQIGQSLVDFGEAIKKTPWWKTKGRSEALINVINELGAIADVVKRLAEVGTGEEVAAYLTAMSNGLSSIATNIGDFKDVKKDSIDRFKTILSLASSLIDLDRSALISSIAIMNTIPLMVYSLASMDMSTLREVKSEFKSFASDTPFILAQISIFVTSCLAALKVAEAQFQNEGKTLASNIIDGMTLVTAKFNLTAIQFMSLFNIALLSNLKLMQVTGASLTDMLLTGMDSNRLKFDILARQSMLLFMTSIASHLIILKSTGEMITLNIIDGMNKHQKLFTETANESLAAYILVLNAGIILAYNTSKNIAESASKGLRSTISRFRDSGRDAGDGFVRGLESMINRSYRAGYDLGNAAYEAARRALDEHSPSRKMGQVGDFAGVGFVDGLKAYISDAEDTGEDLGKSTMNGLKDAITKNLDIPDFTNPVIKPELDLTDIKNGANTLSSMLDSDKTISLASGINFDVNKANIMGDLVGSLVDSTTSGDEMIFGALQGLREDLYSLQKVVGNLQVVMDSGSLVGAIAPSMDNALGQMANLKRRGV